MADALTYRLQIVARNLLVRFPDVHDGWDRLGMVHEARGDSRQAAECYRKMIDDYDAGMVRCASNW